MRFHQQLRDDLLHRADFVNVRNTDIDVENFSTRIDLLFRVLHDEIELAFTEFRLKGLLASRIDAFADDGEGLFRRDDAEFAR